MLHIRTCNNSNNNNNATCKWCDHSTLAWDKNAKQCVDKPLCAVYSIVCVCEHEWLRVRVYVWVCGYTAGRLVVLFEAFVSFFCALTRIHLFISSLPLFAASPLFTCTCTATAVKNILFTEVWHLLGTQRVWIVLLWKFQWFFYYFLFLIFALFPSALPLLHWLHCNVLIDFSFDLWLFGVSIWLKARGCCQMCCAVLAMLTFLFVTFEFIRGAHFWLTSSFVHCIVFGLLCWRVGLNQSPLYSSLQQCEAVKIFDTKKDK